MSTLSTSVTANAVADAAIANIWGDPRISWTATKGSLQQLIGFSSTIWSVTVRRLNVPGGIARLGRLAIWRI